MHGGEQGIQGKAENKQKAKTAPGERIAMDAVCSARRARLAGSGIDEGAVAGAWVQHARRRREQAGRQARLELGVYGGGYAGKWEGKPAALTGSGWRAGLGAGFAAAIPFGRAFEFRN